MLEYKLEGEKIMNIGITTEDEKKWRETAESMLAEKLQIQSTHDDFVCVIDGSQEHQDRSSEPGRIFYSFGHNGTLFHLSFD